MRRKQMFLRFISLFTALMLMVCMIPNTVRAETVVGEGFSFNSDTGELTISENNGPDNFFFSNTDKYDLVTTVSFVGAVNKIEISAFADFYNLQNITIPSSVDFIDTNAFDGCMNLKTVKFLDPTPPTFTGSSITGNPTKFNIYVPCVYSYDARQNIESYFDSLYDLVEYGHVTGLSLDKTVLDFTQIGATQQLTATVNPEDAFDKSVSWTSDNTAVASVDQNGNVEATGYGNTTIRATYIDGGYMDSCTVSVQEPITVNIDTQPQNLPSKTYGYSSIDAPTLSISASKTAQATLNGVLSYQWYRVKIAGESSDVAFGSNSSSVTVPTGLNAGTYSLYCVVSCDGYSLRSQNATFTVGKASPQIYYSLSQNPIDLKAGDTLHIDFGVKTPTSDLLSGTATIYDYGTYLTTIASDISTNSFSYDLLNITAGDHFISIQYSPSPYTIGNYTSVTKYLDPFTTQRSDLTGFQITPVTGMIYGDPSFLLAATMTGSDGVEAADGVTFSVPADNGVLTVSGDVASIVGVGRVTVTATRAEDDLFNAASASYDVVIGIGTPTIDLTYFPTSYTFTGGSLQNPLESEVIVTCATYNDIVFTWYKDTITDANRLSGPPSAPGTYILRASVAATNNYYETSTDVMCDISLSTSDVTILADSVPIIVNGWYGDDVAISASGNTVSDSPEGPFTDVYTLVGEGHIQKTLYFKNNQTGFITTGREIIINIDRTPPSFTESDEGIAIGDKNWNDLPSTISYDTYYNSDQTVELYVTDTGSGNVKFYFYVDTEGSTATKAVDELKNCTFSQILDEPLSISSEGKYVIYAYVVDYVGNQSDYICSGGIVIDKTAPNISVSLPVLSEIGDTYASVSFRSNEAGTISCIATTEFLYFTSNDDLLNNIDTKTIPVSMDQAGSDQKFRFNNLNPNSTYYVMAMSTDLAGNTSSIIYGTSFTTIRTVPIFTETPTITGTYGQELWEMNITQPSSTNGVSGYWGIIVRSSPPVGTTNSYEVTFTPDDTSKYDEVSVFVVPTVNPLSLDTNEVTIGEVSSTNVYDGTPQTPSINVSYEQQSLTSSDYDLSYSNNVNAGTATITITGKGNFTGSVTRTFSIQKAEAPSITFPEASAITYGQPLSASTLSGGSSEYGDFSWTDDSLIPVSEGGYANSYVTFIPNTDTTSNFNISTFTQTVPIRIVKAAPTISADVVVSGTSGARQANISVRVTGVINGVNPTGTIELRNTTGVTDTFIGYATLADGTASYVWTGLDDQVYQVTAIYSGDTNYTDIQAAEKEFDTRKQTQSDLEIGAIGMKTYGDAVFTLTTTGGSGTGTVMYNSSDDSILSISGSMVTILKPGTVTITATKAEDLTYYETTATRKITIAKATPTVTADVSVSGNSGARQAVITAHISGLTNGANPTGTIEFRDTTGTSDILLGSAALVNGVANFTWTDLIDQVYQVTAIYSGDTNYTDIQATEKEFDTRKQAQSDLKIGVIGMKTYGDAVFTLTTTGGSGTGTVTFASSDSSILSISGNKATILKPGTVTITATKAEDANFYLATATREVTINKASSNITLDVEVTEGTGTRMAEITVKVNGIPNGKSPSGTVLIYDCTTGKNVKLNEAKITYGSAIYNWIGLSDQAYKLLVTYNGDSYYVSSSSKVTDIKAVTSKSEIEKFVISLYHNILGREPDATGYTFWVEQLKSGKLTGSNLVFGFLFSNEMGHHSLTDEAFIKVLYRVLFNREPDAKGLQTWQEALNIGASRKLVFAGFVNSSEWAAKCKAIGINKGTYTSDEARDKNLRVTAFVQNFYLTCLNRKGDAVGLNNWTKALNQKTVNGVTVAQGFVFSSEMESRHLSDAAYVDTLYLAMLGRKADYAGKANWVAQLKAGKSRAEVFQGFANSKEFAELCAKYGIEKGNI